MVPRISTLGYFTSKITFFGARIYLPSGVVCDLIFKFVVEYPVPDARVTFTEIVSARFGTAFKVDYTSVILKDSPTSIFVSYNADKRSTA